MAGSADYYLKIDGIPGESQDKKHKNEIELIGWNWGQTQPVQAGGTTAGRAGGRVSMHDFSFSMHINKASPKLFLACATGQHIKSAVLTCRRAGTEQQEYLKITFSDLLVSNYQTGGSSGGETVPVEQVSINFTKIEMSYAGQKSDGTLDSPVVHNYNITQNTGA